MTAAETRRVAILVKGESGRASQGWEGLCARQFPLNVIIPIDRGGAAPPSAKKSGTGARVNKIRLTVSEI
jgi:hypothetical protein